jgi:hypothetical protein
LFRTIPWKSSLDVQGLKRTEKWSGTLPRFPSNKRRVLVYAIPIASKQMESFGSDGPETLLYGRES